MENVQGVDISNYEEKKAAGLIAVALVGKVYVISTRKFSPDDGSEVAAQTVALPMEVFTAAREELEGRLAELNILISDLEALNT